VVLQVAVPEEAQPWLAGPQPSSLSFRLQDSANTWRNESASTWLNADSSGRAEMSELAPGAYVLEAEPFYDRERYKGGPIKRFFTTDKVPFVVQPSKPGDDSPLDLGTLQMHAEGEDAPPEAKAPPPGFIIDRLEGGTLSLQELRGRHVLIDFWAVWCKPCEAQLPHLKQVWQEFGQRSDFVLLGLCLGEDLEIIRKFVAEHGSSWPQGVLQEGFGDPVAKQYGVTSLPHILLIGPDGKVVADNLLDDGIESAVRTALGAAHS
jgi:thiol-disulfide isomerase/thioredoxin